MDVAGDWYTSATFWAGAGAIAVVLSTVAIVWVTLVVGVPRRRLVYRMRAIAPLVSAPEGIRGDLELRHRGKLLSNPRALTVELVSRGRRDIGNDAYNDGQPLRLDFGAPIVELLQVVSEPATLPSPVVVVDGTSVNIGPSLIGRRHAITITVLTDGGQPALSCQSPLIDVQVQGQSDESLTVWAVGVVLGFVLLGVGEVLALTAHGPLGLIGIILFFVGIAIIIPSWIRGRIQFLLHRAN